MRISRLVTTCQTIALTCALISGPVFAQQKYTYTYSSPPDSSKYVRDYSVEIEDAPGHKVRLVEVQRTYIKDHPTILGTKVLETWFRGTTDYGPNGGPGHGYETWILEDGGKLFLESTFVSSMETTASGTRRGTSYATAKFLGGTGKYLTIRGTLTSSTEFDSDPKTGYNRPVTHGEYWLQ